MIDTFKINPLFVHDVIKVGVVVSEEDGPFKHTLRTMAYAYKSSS